MARFPANILPELANQSGEVFEMLEDDPFTVDATKRKDVPVWGTALSGKVFKASE